MTDSRLLDLGLMAFATDYPEATQREIQAYYEKQKAK